MKRKFSEAAGLTEWSRVAAGDVGAEEFERTHVHEVYRHIAGHFSSTRYKPWPQVAEFVNSEDDGSFVLDVGCGNGKSICGVDHSKKTVLGCDASESLLRHAVTQGVEGQVANALALPYGSARFDAVISIAMLHHLSTPCRREQALAEMLRVLRPGGKMLVYVWAAGQKRFNGAESQDVAVPWTVHERFRKQKRPNDAEAAAEPGIEVPARWEAPKEVTEDVQQRYYHLFVKDELEGLLQKAAHGTTVRIVRSYYDSDNWCVVAQKMPDTPA